MKKLILIGFLVGAFSCADDASNNAANGATNSTTTNVGTSNNVAANSVIDTNNVATDLAAERAASIVTADDYTRLILEVDAVAGLEPEDIDDRIETYLAGIVDKPDGIEVVRDQTIEGRGSDYIWTVEDLNEVMNETNTLELQPNEVKIHVVFVDGGYENDSDEGSVLGLAWNTRVAMFGETITASCEGLLQDRLCGYTESSILLHEIGHIMGLVDNGAPLTEDHLDEENGHHCTNPDCLMYWSFHGSSLIDSLRGRLNEGDESLFELDDACVHDLAAIE